MLSPDAALLTALRLAPGHVAPSELAEELGLTTPRLFERIEGLREAGFDLELHPTLGCRLRGAPDCLMADDLWSRLASRGTRAPQTEFLREIVVLAETGSTNDVAARLGREGIAGGVLVLAETQTAGRGRFGRKWESAAGRGLWMSLLLRPALPMERWERLTTWAAVAVSAAIDQCAQVRSAIKWPNDVQVLGKKAAGILIEIGADQAQQPFAVVGIGINANQEFADFPPELREIAQSLRLASGRAVDRPALAAAVVEQLQSRWGQLESGFERLIAEAERRSSLLGRWVRVRMNDAITEGIAEQLDADGHLLLRPSSGALVKLIAGEVTLRA